MNPLVLLPGMNCSDDLWADCDLGETITPPLDEPTLDRQVNRFLQELPPRFVLAGLSLGGIVGMALALMAPERVAGLCVISTNAKAPTETQRHGWDDWIQRLADGESPRSLQERIMPALLQSSVRETREDLVERTLRMADETGPARLRAQLRMQGTRSDLLGRLPELRMPVLVVSGEKDEICPPTFHTEIAHAVESARLVSIEAGHLLPLERPSQFSALLTNWRARRAL